MRLLGSLVSIVDDDLSIRESIPDLLKESGYGARAFASAKEFLDSDAVLETECLILDIAMPGMSGPELWGEMKHRGIRIPVIFITAGRDGALRARLIREGAVNCLFKPFADTAILDALKAALHND